MAVFKCKMCGGSLEVQPGTSVVVCDYCGSTQTIPNLSDDRRANLFDRANHFRRANEFDKAMNLYEQILNEDNSDAEAHWGVVLCRYGIEYVEDPATHKRIPTVNRAQFSSVFADEDYKAAMQYADGYQRDVYEAEAKAIEEIQKCILAISQKEEPFDVFISFKETDANGRRTPDAVLANELYHQLTQEGFKVFFAPITLEDKLGSEYEPYIFAALNSSKAMVVLGTKQEYFNAVWVRNEWSRFLALIKNGAKKTLIPAFKDMDPYDLPEEFSHLMAQDMSKLGFMQDLIRGIKKILSSEEKTAPVRETVTVQTTAPAGNNIAPLLERAFMALEDGEWRKADDFCEQVLNQDAKNVQAYLGKLMTELHVRKKADLKNCDVNFENNSNYQRTLKFADDALKRELEGYCACAGKKAEALRARTEETAQKKKKQFSIIIPAVVACIALILLITKVIIPTSQKTVSSSIGKENVSVEDTLKKNSNKYYNQPIKDGSSDKFPYAVNEETIMSEFGYYQPVELQSSAFPTAFTMAEQITTDTLPSLQVHSVHYVYFPFYEFNQIEIKQIEVREGGKSYDALVNTEMTLSIGYNSGTNPELDNDKIVGFPYYFVKDKNGTLTLLVHDMEGGNFYIPYQKK